jgi:hypothetical protein
MRNLFYYNTSVIDLGKLREAATKHATGDVYDPTQQETIIHYHDREQFCRGKQHEKFVPGPEGPVSYKYVDTGAD